MEGAALTESQLRADKSNYKKYLDSFNEDVKKAYNQSFRSILESIKKNSGMRIIHCGMGGSSISAELMKTYLYEEELIIESVVDYNIQGLLKSSDLVIISSYSGNTEEAISCYRQVRRIGAQLIVITSGGKLEEFCSSGKVPLIKIPKGYPPRAAVPYMFFTMLKVFEDLGLITSRMQEVQELVDKMLKQNLNEFALNLSEKLYGKIPLIYSSNNFYSVAYRWKTQFNENAKTVAFSNKFPELNHNEIAGYNTKNGIFHVIIISADSDFSRMRKRMQITKEILQKSGVDVTELHVKGNKLLKIFSAVMAGDLTSYYLALRYNTDPLPVDVIEGLKRQIGPFI